MARKKRATVNQAEPEYQLNNQELIAIMKEDLMLGMGLAYETYKKYLVYPAHNVLDNTPRLAHLAEDAVHDGFMNAIRYLKEKPAILDDPNFKLQAYLTKIIRNQALAILRTGQKHIVINSGVTGEEMEESIEEGYITHYGDPMLYFERAIEKMEARQTIRENLATLPQAQRTAIEQMYLKDPKPDGKPKTNKETAGELNLPLKTVKTQIRRGMEKMREQIDHESEPQPRKENKTS